MLAFFFQTAKYVDETGGEAFGQIPGLRGEVVIRGGGPAVLAAAVGRGRQDAVARG